MTSSDITRLLRGAAGGSRTDFDRVIPLVYAELHRIARRQLRRLRPGDTLDTTGLIHEAYIKLVSRDRGSWRDRNHFYGIAARAMRDILVDYARRRQAQKRGGGAAAITLDEARATAVDPEDRLLEIDAALERLAELDPRLPRIVECLFFAGFTHDETASALGVSERTVRRDWQRARVWLHEELRA